MICLLFSFTSCEYFSFEKNKNIEKIDVDVDFTSVDVSPSFKVCDSLIEKEKKNTCFRTTLRQEISSSLAKQSIQVPQSVDETIEVAITIQSNKEVKLTSIKSSDSLMVILPSLKAILKKSVEELPAVYPAIKRGIPVTTVYKLPIRIAVKN
ncbi:hypothetical protein N9290_01865 [Flavobacteriaceae bacterium]|nr:hypothetical protein [Flavobacteriaceae bacterium]MDB4559871.1 hypothetical protein [Flavobacteriaceae bacterium]MDC3284900.1 hypothetical protein [Flavobacteriaceae bacterium]MDC3318257.1 hypothetical protein [Flavobacteriaceae bacterium]